MMAINTYTLWKEVIFAKNKLKGVSRVNTLNMLDKISRRN